MIAATKATSVNNNLNRCGSRNEKKRTPMLQMNERKVIP